MASLSKLHSKCNECKYKDKCDEKRMVACGVMELSPKGISMNNLVTIKKNDIFTDSLVIANARTDMKAPTSEPMAKEYTPITIYRGENCTIGTSLEEIKRQIEEDFYKNIRCEFNRTL